MERGTIRKLTPMKLPNPPTKPSIYDQYLHNLHNITKTHPPDETWLPWPNQKNLTIGTRRAYRAMVNRGERLGPGLQARIVGGWLYVRVKPE